MTPDEELESRIKESARWAQIADVHQLQTGLHSVSNERLIMLGLSELIAFMPKSGDIGGSREALYRELWRRGVGDERTERGR